MSSCYQCDKSLTGDEMGLYKKLVNRGAESFLCRECLAEKFQISPELIDEKIKQFKKQGCTLFI